MNQWNNWLKRMVAKIKGIAWKKQFLESLPYLAFGYVFDKLSWQYRISDGINVFEKFVSVMGNVTVAFANPFPSFQEQDIVVGLLAGSGLWIAVFLKRKNAKKFL